jgi:hypothetical protein
MHVLIKIILIKIILIKIILKTLKCNVQPITIAVLSKKGPYLIDNV